MKIITKQRDETLKNFNLLKIMFFRYKDKKEEIIEDVVKIETTKTKIEPVVNKTAIRDITYRRIPQRTLNHGDEESVAKRFDMFSVGQSFYVSNTRYTVLRIPNIDYERTYLPFFLLLRNGFLREN